MKIINNKSSETTLPMFLLLGILFLIIMIVREIIIDKNIDILIYTSPFLLVSIYFLDIFSWHYFGKEIITISDNKLIIQKRKRIFMKKKVILLSRVQDISVWNKNVWNIDILRMYAFWDWTCQGPVCITYGSGKYCLRKYYCGKNLTEIEGQNLVTHIKEDVIIWKKNTSFQKK
jgi:hypothetical protein